MSGEQEARPRSQNDYLRERAERAEAEVERLQNMRDSIGMKLTAAEARARELEGALRGLIEKVEQGWRVLRSPDYSRGRCAVEGAQLRRAAERARAALTDTSEEEI